MSKEVIEKIYPETKEVTKLKEELKATNEKLVISEAFKGHFISNITNEIINPFTSILGISKSIMDLKEKQIGQIHSMANLIYNESFELDFQLRNIFEAAKIEAGETNIESNKLRIVNTIEAEVERFRFKAEKKSLYFDTKSQIEENIGFITDAAKFKIIIANLISNAIKFSRDKNKIEIVISMNNNTLEISISNIGVGLSQKDIKVMFDRFLRLDERINSINNGHGLGLSIVSYYIDLLGGKIEVTSKESINTVMLSLPELSHNNMEGNSEETDFFDDFELFDNDSELF